jgi:hypothetical protein
VATRGYVDGGGVVVVNPGGVTDSPAAQAPRMVKIAMAIRRRRTV